MNLTKTHTYSILTLFIYNSSCIAQPPDNIVIEAIIKSNQCSIKPSIYYLLKTGYNILSLIISIIATT